jgi:hypothetical protein
MYRTSGPERYSPHFRRVAGLRIDLRSVVVTKGMIRAAYSPHAVACCQAAIYPKSRDRCSNWRSVAQGLTCRTSPGSAYRRRAVGSESFEGATLVCTMTPRLSIMMHVNVIIGRAEVNDDWFW